MGDINVWSIDVVPEPETNELPFWQFLLGIAFCLAVGMSAGSYLATL